MMRAVVVDPDGGNRLALRKVEKPSPSPSEALVRVFAVSLNRGEVRRSQEAEAGFRPGWDLAGTVERAAGDGTGPPEGTRVVGLIPSGAWAERAAVPTNALAALPDGVSFAEAATLPVAGLTALYALEKGDNLLGRTTLVTGASGGAGHFAVQLARTAGSRVVALIRRPEHEQLVREAGAHEVVIDKEARPAGVHGPYHLILESVGGRVLGEALSMLAPGGTCVSFGASASPETTFRVPGFFGSGAASLYGFILFHEALAKPASEGLARLAELVAGGRLRPHIGLEVSWEEIGSAAASLLDRLYTGKAVLHLR